MTETIAETKQQTDSVISGAHIKKGFEEEELF